MSKYIFTRDDGSRFVADLDEDEAALVEAALAADDDDEDGEEEEGEDQEEESDENEPSREADSAEEFARVEAVYRNERAAIKASNDAADLRRRRQAMEGVLRDGRQSNIAHTRARDLLGEIEQRELRILAERSGKRGR
jgi:hypothetical protein